MTLRRMLPWALAGTLVVSLAVFARTARSASASQVELKNVLERNATARGGLEAWRRVQAMAWTGHVESADGRQLPFLLAQRRPNQTRFEIMADGQRSMRVFDGQKGWKVRATATDRPEPQLYTEEELRAARDAPSMEGPILDAAAKGVEVKLDGLDEVEGRKAYRLTAKLPSGTTQHVWIDAESYLDLKYDRPARDAAGRGTTVSVFYRDYHAFEGLQIPLTIETHAPGGELADRLVIERVSLDPPLPLSMFARPDLRRSRRGVLVDTRGAQDSPAAVSSR